MEHYINSQGQEMVALVSMDARGGASEQSDALEKALVQWADVAELSDGVDKEVSDFVDSLVQVIDWDEDSILDIAAEVARRLVLTRASN